jgi:hypothetical protein
MDLSLEATAKKLQTGCCPHLKTIDFTCRPATVDRLDGDYDSGNRFINSISIVGTTLEMITASCPKLSSLAISHCANLTGMNRFSCRESGNFMPAVLIAKNLLSLKATGLQPNCLNDRDAVDSFLLALSTACPFITLLHLGEWDLNPKSLDPIIVAYPNLRSLDVSHTSIDDTTLKGLASGCPHFVWLVLDQCPCVTEVGFNVFPVVLREAMAAAGHKWVDRDVYDLAEWDDGDGNFSGDEYADDTFYGEGGIEDDMYGDGLDGADFGDDFGY